MERQFESFGTASLDELLKHSLHALQASLQVSWGAVLGWAGLAGWLLLVSHPLRVRGCELQLCNIHLSPTQPPGPPPPPPPPPPAPPPPPPPLCRMAS